MERVTGIMKNNSLIRNINRQQHELGQVQNRLSTGKRIKEPSDNPSAATNQMFFRTRLSELKQFESNIDTAKNRLDLSDGELARVNDIMQRIRVLTVQASNGTYQGDDGFELRKVIATEIDQHLRALIEIANGMDGTGRPLFGGHTTGEKPFEIINSEVEGMENLEIPEQIVKVVYRGDNGKRLHEVERDQYIDVNVPGNQVFWGTNMSITGARDTSNYVAQSEQRFRIDNTEITVTPGDTVDDILDKINSSSVDVTASKIGQNFLSLHTGSPHQIWLEDVEGGTVLRDLGLVSSDKSDPPNNYSESARVSGRNLFDVVIKLRDDLFRRDQLEIGGRDLGEIDSAIDNILKYRAEVGARTNRLDEHMKRVSWDQTYMTELLAKNEGIDVPEEIMNLKWLESVHQQSLNVGARVIRPTLMDFLR